MASGLRLGLGRLRFRLGRKVIILITDGVPDDREATLEAARLARPRGVTLIPIGTGEADHAFLATLAGRPELARHVATEDLAGAIEDAATGLDEGSLGGGG
ncbi:MAG: VWA domain-containing protein, partial [Bacteroidales bacterium]